MSSAFLFALTLTAAQQTIPLIEPSDSTLAPRCAVATVDTMELVVTTPGQPERLLSTLVKMRSPAIETGNPVCVITQRYIRPGGADLDSSVVDARSLAPRRYAAYVGAERHRFAFTADSALGAVQHGDSTPRTIAHGSVDPFFLGVADLEVVRALPLAIGMRARMRVYNPPQGFRMVTIGVEALDTITVSGIREVAWRVAYDAGAAPTVLWLRHGDHELLRSRSDLANGAVFWRRRPGGTGG